MQIILKSSIITGRINYSAFYKIFFLIKTDKEQLEPKCNPEIKLDNSKLPNIFQQSNLQRNIYLFL